MREMEDQERLEYLQEGLELLCRARGALVAVLDPSETYNISELFAWVQSSIHRVMQLIEGDEIIGINNKE